MTIQTPRTRTLILGCDYPTFHLYWRYYSQLQDREIVGFVYCFDGDIPIKNFKGIYKHPHSVYPLQKLETTILEKRIQKCVIQVQNIPMPKVQSIINRILSTGTCGFEFIPTGALVVKSFKPIIAITSLAPKLGKSQLARYFCSILCKENRRVAVIYPLPEILPNSHSPFTIESSPHYEFNQADEIPPDTFSIDDESQIKSYQSSGAYKIFATSDTRHAIICAEQCADVIIFDSHSCETPFINVKARFCVVSDDALNNVRNTSLWPGLVNVMESKNIVVLTRGQRRIEEKKALEIKRLLKEHTIYYASSHFVIDNSSGSEVFNRKVIPVDNTDEPGISSAVAKTMGASELVVPSVFLTDGIGNRGNAVVASLPRASSPTANTKAQTKTTLEKLAAMINKTDADVVIVSLNHDIPGLDRSKMVLYTSPEIDDTDGALYKWLSQFFQKSANPPLKNHFEAQVDIIMALAHASDKELFVTNNDSANRESFCRLFLQSHLPPGFRVTTGEIIDCSSHLTGQLDVIIVNDVCPRLTIDTTKSVIAPVPADCVLGVIEVKTTLTQEALKKALSQMRPVKALMPTHTTLQLPDGRIVSDPLGGKIITGIFSFNPTNDIEDKIPEIIEMFPNVVDFIVLPDAFGFFSERTLQVCGMSVGSHQVINGYVKFTAKGMGLALIFGILNSLAAIRRFSGLNCVRYLSGTWGAKSDMIQKNIIEVKKKVSKLDKYFVNMETSSKEEFFKTKDQYIQNYNKVVTPATEEDNN